ncbi:MAG: hypothetical protein A2V70_15665 [Planctomycetes bacterium RBG_13_63_9]|nr:MAG: hypothetical protein A2V70_15665 [Planctomycetes bacterium RBG_13_63_9]
MEDPAAVESDADSTVGDPTAGLDDILNLDLEQLGKVDVVVPSMDVEVTSVTRTESTVGRSPAAVFVITPEMIRRSGATCIPEVLRMVPGMEVARINASQWAITCRGFNGRYNNKLLVQIDGRSVYSPIYGNVLWEVNDVMLQDVQRIEVIRGPGSTLWGSNAVNGIINIITKPAKDTQGLLIHGGAGTEERGFTGVRYGGGAGSDLNWRVYGKQFDRDGGSVPQGNSADDWRMAQTGFRADWTPNRSDAVTLQGDYYTENAGRTVYDFLATPPYEQHIEDDGRLCGGNVLGRWSRDLGKDSNWTLQLYFDRRERHYSTYDQNCNTLDVDFQRQSSLGMCQKIVWGAGYRYWDNIFNVYDGHAFNQSVDPNARSNNTFSYFVQDQITLRDDLLYLTVGSKFEHNEFTNFEYQPGARLLWTPDERQSVWAAITRAVRIPSLVEEDIRIKIRQIPMGPPPPMFVQITGNRAIESEDLLSYEVGYRAQPSDRFSWDLALFYNKYVDIIGFVPDPLGFPLPLVWPWVSENALDGETYGGEITATWQFNPCWRVTGSYSYLQMQLHKYPGIAADPAMLEYPEGESPHNQVYFRSSWDLARTWMLDVALRYVDSIHSSQERGVVPSYTTMDARLAWQPTANFEMAVVGQNLLDRRHYEYFFTDVVPTEVDRGVYATVTLRR